MASIDQIRASDGSGNASVATVQSTRSGGASTIIVDTVQGINGTFMGTMGTPHTFTDPVTSETITVISEATAVDFAGHVDGSNLEIDTIAPGYTDNGSAVGDIVIIRPTTQWGDNVADVLDVSHDDDGTLKDDSVHSSSVIADGAAPVLRAIRHYTADDTWNKPAGMVGDGYVEVEVQAGGGGGSGAAASSAGNWSGASGGGGGGYSRKRILAAALGGTETVTVGAAGAGGAAGANDGTAGGNSSFGAHATATGGGGGTGRLGNGSTTAVFGGGGGGGNGSGGDVNIAGATTSRGLRLGAAWGVSSPGGASHLSTGINGVNDSNGAAASGYGGGGGGGASANGAGAAAGGNGSAGIVIVREYY